MKYIVLEKIKDKVYNGMHPNGINVGDFSIKGFPRKPLTVGEQFILDTHYPSWTSKVVSFTDEIIETENSTYKIHYLHVCNDCTVAFLKSKVVAEEHCCPKCFSTNFKILENERMD